MKSRSLLIVAVVSGLLAVILVNLYLLRREASLGTTIKVMKSRRDLAAHAPVSKDDFEAVDFPERHIGAFRDPATKEGSMVIREDHFAHLLNHPLRRSIGAGEFLLWSHFEPPLGPRLDVLIPPGMVAVTVPLDRTTRSAELISPGDQVDVYAITDAGGRGGVTTELLLPVPDGVTVLAVGSQVLLGSPFAGGRDRAEASSVTLAVKPEYVPKFGPAATGRMSLMLVLRPAASRPAPPAPPSSK